MGQGSSLLYGISELRLIQVTGAHRSTVRRWKLGRSIPRWLSFVVRLCVQGELEDFDPAWRGWRIVRGELVSPEGTAFTPGAIRAGPLYRERALEYGEWDRQTRMALEVDPVNRAGIERLGTLQAALEAVQRAMDEITGRLSPLERNRLFSAAREHRKEVSLAQIPRRPARIAPGEHAHELCRDRPRPQQDRHEEVPADGFASGHDHDPKPQAHEHIAAHSKQPAHLSRPPPPRDREVISTGPCAPNHCR